MRLEAPFQGMKTFIGGQNSFARFQKRMDGRVE
jgi:hypothetical protein